VFVPKTTAGGKLAALAQFSNVRVASVDGSSEDARLAADAYCAERNRSGEPVWLADQYGDRAAVLAHALTTAPEILLQTRGRATHVIAGVGTGSTSTGLALGLRRLGVAVVGVQPTTSNHALIGLKFLPGVPPSLVPRNAQMNLLNQVEYVCDRDALTAMRQLINHGFFFGPSTGAVAVAAARIAQREAPNGVLVLIGHDSSSLYA
jgi:cysteine synthase